MTESMRDLLARHEGLVTRQTSDPEYVALHIEQLKELMVLAHDAVHPAEPEDDDNPSVELGYDSVQLRLQCLHLATQVDINRVSANAAHGVQWSSDPVGLAEAYYAFLKGPSDGTL